MVKNNINKVYKINREKIKSSNLKSVGYNLNSKILEVEFNNGAIYQYFSVPQTLYNNLMKASSHGKFFIKNIKDKFRYKKIK